MNLRRVLHSLALVLFVLSGAQLLPLLWADSWADVRAFLTGAGITGAVGLAMRFWGNREGELYRREGVLIVVGSWVLASLGGAIPYLVSGVLPNPADALFESASGFTTTGATVLTDLSIVGEPILFWRSFTQWLGGIGIVVLFVALLSELGAGARFLFKLEVPGPKAEVLHARVQDTALALARIYLAISLAEVVLLLAAGLSIFDAVTHTFSTVSTGGFSPHPASVGHFSPVVQGIVMVFMLAAGINFSLYFALVRRRDRSALGNAELRLYGLVVAAATVVLSIDLVRSTDAPLLNAPFDSLFTVISIVTTTGFSTEDFSEWPSPSRAVLVALMVFGGCAGSTAGGAKIVRAMVCWRAALREVRLTFSPNSVIAIVVGRDPVPEESVRSIVALVVLWVAGWGAGSILLCIGEVDLITAATAAIATLSNIGPGLAAVGPFGDYSFFAPWQKLVMVGLMWLGRLEFFALLALFQRQFWRT
jgi:trk system potassium uptake protein TrkH